MSKEISLLLSGVAICALLPTAAFAQAETQRDSQGLSEIIVTATRTGETKAQSTPLAITVLSGDSLDAAGVRDARDLSSLTPNLKIAQVTVNPEIYIRGVGTNNVFAGSDPDVTYQLDGVYISRPYAQLADFLDVQRIEVLRGPQGTLYGRNAVGGTFNVISRLPSDEFHGEVSIEGGDYSLIHPQAYLSGPIIPGVLRASIAMTYTKHDDYEKNVLPGLWGAANANHGGVKAQLLFTPTNNLQFITRGDYSKAHEHQQSFFQLMAPWPFSPIANSLIGNYQKIAVDTAPIATTEVWGISEEINYNVSDHISLKSLTAYRASRLSAVVDSDATEIPYNFNTQGDRDRGFSQEFNLRFRWDRLTGVAGVYYMREWENSFVTSYVAPSVATTAVKAFFAKATPVTNITSRAAFVQGTYSVTDTIHVTAGIRYTRDTKTIEQNYIRTSLNPATLGATLPGFPFTGTTTRVFSAATPKLSIDWQVRPSIMLYAGVTKGWKSGGTNYAATNTTALSFQPETLVSYEGGIKSEWFGRRLRLNLTGFIYKYDNLQVQTLLAPGNLAIGNAANADVSGIEFESMFKPIPSLTFMFNYSLLDATYRSYPNASVGATLAQFLVGNPRYNPALGTYDATGNRLNASPKSSFSVSAQYEHTTRAGKIFARVEDAWQAKAYFDPTNLLVQSQKAYSLVNLSAGYTDTRNLWTIAVRARNVGNTQYLVTVASNSVEPGGLAGAPRTLSVELSKRW